MSSNLPPIPRYFVIVYFYDHWAVTFESDDKAEAARVCTAASLKVPVALLVDSTDLRVRPVDAHPPVS